MAGKQRWFVGLRVKNPRGGTAEAHMVIDEHPARLLLEDWPPEVSVVIFLAIPVTEFDFSEDEIELLKRRATDKLKQQNRPPPLPPAVRPLLATAAVVAMLSLVAGVYWPLGILVLVYLWQRTRTAKRG